MNGEIESGGLETDDKSEDEAARADLEVEDIEPDGVEFEEMDFRYRLVEKELLGRFLESQVEKMDFPPAEWKTAEHKKMLPELLAVLEDGSGGRRRRRP